MGVRREGVDDFTGPGVVKFFPSFVLDGAGVGLEVVHVPAQAGVLLLQVFNFALELLFLGALLVPGGEAVAAVDDAPRKGEGEQDREDGTGRTPALLNPEVGALAKWKRLVGRFLFFGEQIGLLQFGLW